MPKENQCEKIEDEEMEKDMLGKYPPRKDGITILISDKTEFQGKALVGSEEHSLVTWEHLFPLSQFPAMWREHWVRHRWLSPPSP